ncbi:MAG: hypothetical protein HQK60_00385 [Deltaproteobacteria bacterium]|nr:hypothetical protein [Deltaproteobacteria bacterium]
MIILLGCLTGVTPAQSLLPEEGTPGDHVFDIQAAGLKRQYIVHVPAGYDGQTSVPVVMMFHGAGGMAQTSMLETGLAGKADKETFLAVFPEGSRPKASIRPRFLGNPQTWNDGSNRSNVGATQRKVDDVGFVNALIDDLISRFRVDEHRIYATGFSNGASMVFRLGRQLSRRLAAIAPVAGSDWLGSTKIDRPISLLYITGTADPLNPINGGDMVLGWRVIGHKPPVREQIQRWVEMLGCPPAPKVIYDRDGVKGVAYSPGNAGSEVVWYTIERMGHVWPGGIHFLPEKLIGKPSDKIKANEVIWEFFRKHPK